MSDTQETKAEQFVRLKDGRLTKEQMDVAEKKNVTLGFEVCCPAKILAHGVLLSRKRKKAKTYRWLLRQ